MNRKKYNSLSQLDRVEYLLLKRNNFYYLITPRFIFVLFQVIMLFLILGLLAYYHGGDETALDPIRSIIPLLKPLVYIVLALDIFGIVTAYYRAKKIDKRFPSRKEVEN